MKVPAFGEAALENTVDGALGAATEFTPDLVVFDTVRRG
jgi:hypothetical protein